MSVKYNYYFVLGRENKISQAEIEAVLANFGFYFESRTNFDYSISILSDSVLKIKSQVNIDAEIKKLPRILAGTVKIFKEIADFGDPKLLAEEIGAQTDESKIIFGISDYGKKPQSKSELFRLGLEIKKALKKNNRSARLVAAKEGSVLSSAQSYQYRMDIEAVEIGIFEGKIARLLAVQDINFWNQLDYGKPRSDAKSGMLPPKLARMMINLALGQIRDEKLEMRNEDALPLISQASNTPTTASSFKPHLSKLLLVDPFCGSGNIVLSALDLGFQVFASDLSEKAVLDTQANARWLLSRRPKLASASEDRDSSTVAQNDNVSQADATKFDFSKIDQDFLLVTEPFLGQARKAKLLIEEEKEIAKEVGQLYVDFFSNLKSAGPRLKTVCIIFPLFELKNGKKLSIYNLLVDKLENFGYINLCPPLIYGRDYQVVKREIVLIQLKDQKSKIKNKEKLSQF